MLFRSSYILPAQLCAFVYDRENEEYTMLGFKDYVDKDWEPLVKNLSRESDYIQSQLYRNSVAAKPRNTRVIYYDCSNYYFETESDDDFRKYGQSKEHRPNPIVQLGLFMDADGLPLAFCVNPGNTPETQTMQPLEEKLADNFSLSDFVACTDGGQIGRAHV